MAQRTKGKSASQTGRQHVSRRLDELKPHPRQAEVFDDLDGEQFAQLVDSIRTNGLQDPIHIAPDNTILSGHQRLRVAQELGWTHIDCIIRRDLAAIGPAAVDQYFVESNTHRRQLGILEMARCYRELQRLERSKGSARRHHTSERQDLRDRLAKRFHCSGRQLDRIARLLDLPRAIQHAAGQGKLPVSQAERLFGLDDEQRRQAAELIEAGTDPRKVLKRFAPAQSNKLPRQRLEMPERSELRRDLMALTSFFVTGHFDAYVRSLERHPSDTTSAVKMLRRAQQVANELGKRLGKYVEAARVPR